MAKRKRDLRIGPAGVARFASRVQQGAPDACWPWQGGRNKDGYGVLRVGIGSARRLLYAHRVAYFIAYGSPAGLQVLHECDVRACCNPAHLFAGTQGDNVRDMIAKGRARWQR